MRTFEFKSEEIKVADLSYNQFIIHELVRKKFLSIAGFIFFLLISILISFAVYEGELISLALIFAASIGIPLLVFSIIYVHFGVYLLLVISFFILGILRFVDIPLGLIIDSLVVILLVSVTWQLLGKRDWKIFSNASGKIVLIWILYNILEVVNPETSSKLAWVYAIRGVSIILLFYFVAAYAINTPNKLYVFVEIIVFLSLLLGLYGLFQEFYGILPIEEAWIREDEQRLALYYNWGKFRKFSYFSSPTIFGITAASVGILCFVLSLGPVSFFKKVYYWATTLILFLSMVFSGTRTAYAILPAALFFFAVITLKKNTIIVTIVLLVIGAGIILSPIQSLGPIDANNLERIRSAFLFQEDPSFNVRLKNQAYIQPYIQNHPFGAGLGSCGEIGLKYAPDSPFANFPPDSGFVKIGVESGYVGLAIYCILLFIIVRDGLLTYISTRDPKLRNYLVACLTLVFSMVIANYAQETITFCPINIIMYVIMATLVNINPNPENKRFSTNETNK